MEKKGCYCAKQLLTARNASDALIRSQLCAFAHSRYGNVGKIMFKIWNSSGNSRSCSTLKLSFSLLHTRSR